MKKGKNKKILDILGRKNIIIALIILVVILSITTVWLIVGAVQENKQEYINYTEGSFVGYKVFLKENEFFNQEYLGEDKQYIASLIDYVTADFKYNLNSSDINTKYSYTYKIVAETNVIDDKNNNSIYKFTEDLVKKGKLIYNHSQLVIKENVTIDYNKYNNIINRFKNVYNLSDVTSTVTIKMYVTVEGVSQSSAPVSSLVIPLTTKTVAIDMESNSVNATEISVYSEINKRENLYYAILTFILTVMIIIELFTFRNDTKDRASLYKMKIKKILLNYDSYIQKIGNKFDFSEYQQIEMQTFEDLLQVRDTINEPILMLETIEGKETDFFIPSKEKVVYIYKLKIEDIEEKKKK